MTRKSAIQLSEASLRKMAKLAKEAGVTVELEQANGITIRISPWDPAPAAVPNFPERPSQPRIFPPLHVREQVVLDTLESLGVGVPVSAESVRFAGPFTVNALAERGYVNIVSPEGASPKEIEIALTKKYLSDKKADEAFYAQRPYL